MESSTPALVNTVKRQKTHCHGVQRLIIISRLYLRERSSVCVANREKELKGSSIPRNNIIRAAALLYFDTRARSELWNERERERALGYVRSARSLANEIESKGVHVCARAKVAPEC